MDQVLRGEEKRRFPRVKFRTSLRYQIRGKPEYSNAVSEDICDGGISFAIDRFIAPENNIALQINVLSRVLTPIARVRRSFPLPRSDKYHLGLEFVEFDPGEKKFLRDYIEMQLGRI